MRRLCALLLVGLPGCSAAPEPTALPPTRVAPKTAPAETRPSTSCSRSETAKSPALAAVSLRSTTPAPTPPQASCSPLKSRAGSPVDEKTVDADVRELFASGLFDDVTAVVEDRDDGASTLVFEVKPRRRVDEVAVRGEPRGFASREALGTRPDRYDPVWVRATDARLLEALHLDGYRKAKVDHEITPVGDDAVRVLFWLEPGKRFVLGSVRIEGLKAASADGLKKQLKLMPGEPAFDELIERDRLFVTMGLYEDGLVQGEVTSRVEENFLASTIDVVLTVREGPVFKLGTVKVTGPAAFPAAKYQHIVKRLPRGMVFARSKVAAVVEDVEAMHRVSGTERKVEVSTNVDAPKRTIDVEVIVQ